MTVNSDGKNQNDTVSSPSLTLKTTATKKQTLTSPSSLPTLGFDLIAEIFCRLPLKLVTQLRCLNKFFNSLISNPKFAKNHLRYSKKLHHLIVDRTNFMVDYINPILGCSKISRDFLLFDSPISSVFENSTIVTQTQINYPNILHSQIENNTFDSEFGAPTAVCSCDGILCITKNNDYGILWNPTIRKSKILPSLKNSHIDYYLRYCLYSIGYDNLIGNYKVIVVFPVLNKNEVSVYTLGTDYWRRIDDFTGHNHGYAGVFVSGTVNWLVDDDDDWNNSSCSIVSLDLGKESYQKLSQPSLQKGSLGVLKDCLCIFAKNDMFLDVWIIQDYEGIWK